MRSRWMVGAALLALGVVTPAVAQVSSASGSVVDQQGAGVAGVTVQFRAQGNPTITYEGKTDKKGRYEAAGLFSPKEGDRWEVEFVGEGWVPVKVRIESRTVNGVLVRDVLEAALGPGTKLPEIPIRPLGRAKVDFTVAPASELPVAVIPSTGAPGAASTPAPAAARDPWDQAMALVGAGDLAGSLPAFAAAVAVEPPSAERHEYFAKVLYQLERLDDAATQAKAALAVDPQRLDSRMLIYGVHARRGAWDAAKADLEAALEVAPDNLRVVEQLAVVAGERNDQAAAIAAYERITKIDPRRTDAWVALGGLYARSGEPQKAQDAYQKVAEQNPGDAYQVFYNLGALIMNRKERSTAEVRQAADAFNRAIEIRPDFAPAHHQLGLALLELGNREGARAALERCIQLEPNGPEVAQLRAIIQALPR